MYNSPIGIGHNKYMNLRVNKLTIQETGTYNQQFFRPWETTVDVGVQNAIMNIIGNSYVGTLSPDSFSPVANSFVQKQATPQGEAMLPNGWSERRIRFMLEVQYEFQTGGGGKTYFLGYTDHPGVTMQGFIDPRMVFYVNSYVKTRFVAVPGVSGMTYAESIMESKQIIQGQSSSFRLNDGNSTFGMRPQDLYRYFNADAQLMTIGSNNTGFDGRVHINPNGIITNRNNSIPSHYSCNIFNNLLSKTDQMEMGDTKNKIISQSILDLECNRDSLTQEPFFVALAQCRESYRVSSSFTFPELEKMEPNIQNVMNYIVVDSRARETLHQAGQTAAWHGTDMVTKSAATLAHAVPALLMNNMITRIVLKSSNYEIGGRMVTQIIHGNGFCSMDMRQNYENFRINFEALVLSQLTFNNSLTYALELNVDLLGESWIRISIDNSPYYDYVTPSFADSLFSPVVTSNLQTVQNVAYDFQVLYETIAENNANPNQPGMQNAVGMYQTPASFSSTI